MTRVILSALPLLKLLVLAGLIGAAVFGVYEARGLYADGAYFLLQILNARGFYFDDRARVFAEIVTQAPVVMAVKASITDLNVLIRLHSLGLIAIPLAFWFAALLVQARSQRFWLLLLGFCVSYLMSGFFAAGEYNLMFAMAALIWSLLWTERIHMVRALVIAAISFCLIRSYEAIVFLAPAILPLLLWRTLDRSQSKQVAVTLAIASCCLVVAIVFAIDAILLPRMPSNLAGALDIFVPATSRNFIYVLVMSLLVGGLVAFRPVAHYAWPVMYAGAAISLVFALVPQLWNEPLMYYASRTLSGVMLAIIFFGASLSTSKEPANRNGSYVAIAVTVFCTYLALGVPFAATSIGWLRWASAFEEEAVSAAGYIPVDQTNLSKSGVGGKFFWDWTNPSLSVVLRGDSLGGIKNSSTYTGWQPFDQDKVAGEQLSQYVKSGKLFQ